MANKARKKRITDARRRARIQPILDYWIPRVGLGDWDIKWKLCNRLDEDASARVHAPGAYQTSTIEFSKVEVDKHTTVHELELLVLHELCHLVVCKVRMAGYRLVGTAGYKELEDAEESIADSLSLILYQLRYESQPTAYYVK